MKLSQVAVLLIVLLIPQSTYPLQRSSSIRLIDFANFTYPRVGEQRSYIRLKTFTLKNGEYPEHEIEDGMRFEDVVYGDVTGDGVEEAIVILGIRTRGSAIPDCVYIYTLKNKRPSLLWGFVTGDRADGGLRKVYAESGILVVELFGPARLIEAACCPKRFTRTRYEWRGGRFRRKRRQTLPLPESG